MFTQKKIIIPEKSPNVDTEDNTNNKQQLWHIIENQRTVIHELQKALAEITEERDHLLEKLLHEHKDTTIPTPPPRSPFRSTMSEANYTPTEMLPKSLQPQTKSMTDLQLHDEQDRKTKLLPGLTKVKNQIFIYT